MFGNKARAKQEKLIQDLSSDVDSLREKLNLVVERNKVLDNLARLRGDYNIINHLWKDDVGELLLLPHDWTLFERFGNGKFEVWTPIKVFKMAMKKQKEQKKQKDAQLAEATLQ